MFFTYFNQIASPGVDYHLTISQTADGRLAVSLLPKVCGLNDPAQHRIGPLYLTGTPAELDQGFFPAVAKPVKKTSGIILDLNRYEKQQQEAEANSKAAKDAKENESKEAKEKKNKFDGYMKKAGELEAAENLEGALTQLQQARLHATDKATKTIDGKIAEIKKKIGAGTLFGASPAAQPAVESAHAPVTVPSATGSQHEAAAPSNEPASQFSPATADNPANHAPHATAPAESPVNHTGSASAPANGHGGDMFGPAAHTVATDAPAHVAGNGNGKQPNNMSAAADGTVYREYASSPQPPDNGYPTYREGDYAEYPDFVPPTGSGMGAPMF